MPEKQEEKSPSTQDYVRFKAMHANIEAIEYLLKNASQQIKEAHEHILYNKADEAMGKLHDFENNLGTMLSLYQTSVQLHTAHFKS